jgi:hypothetical protein
MSACWRFGGTLAFFCSFWAGRISFIEPRRREGHEGRRMKRKEAVDGLLSGRVSYFICVYQRYLSLSAVKKGDFLGSR